MIAPHLSAVLWDMDGTLIDTEPLWLEAEAATLNRYGIEMTDEVRNTLIGSGPTALAKLFQDLGVPLSAEEIVEEQVQSVIDGLHRNGAEWRPGALELLRSLGEAGVPCALVTMSVRRLAETVVALLPEGAFTLVVPGDEVAHEKPHPDPYLRAAEQLGVPIEQCLALEDSFTGLRSASSSGAVTVGIPNLVDLSGAPAHQIWETLAGVDAAALLRSFAVLRGAGLVDAADSAFAHGGPVDSNPTNGEAVEGETAENEDGAGAPAPRGPFRYGDRVQLTGPKNRLNTITLVPDGRFHSHRGTIAHADIVGLPDASVVLNNSGEEHLALRPLLSDFVMSMPRGAAIVYPKDAAQILSLGDIFPGARVVEAGVGSGALSLHLLRAVGPRGELHSFERREEFAEVARANAAAFSGKAPGNWSVTVGDLQEELPRRLEADSVDRVVLDMLAPWECVGVAVDALRPGGVLLSYVATATQLSRMAEELRRSGRFTRPQSSETMVRGWHVEGLAVRPDHRMVAHTGFLITARKLAPGTVLPQLKRRASKNEYDEQDIAAWTPDLVDGDGSRWAPEALGERGKSEKVLRKKVREARRLAAERGADPEAN